VLIHYSGVPLEPLVPVPRRHRRGCPCHGDKRQHRRLFRKLGRLLGQRASSVLLTHSDAPLTDTPV
jgi:hypothetical protein